MPTATSYKPIVEGAGLQYGPGGVEITRIIKLDGLEGTADTRLLLALGHEDVPMRGTPHPVDPNLYVDTGSIRLIGPTQAEVTLVYRPFTVDGVPGAPDAALITVGATIQMTETNMDNAGKMLCVQYLYPGATVPTNQPGTIEVPQAMPALRITKLESYDPSYKAIEYVGKINSDMYMFKEPRTWLCTRIEGTSPDGGESYLVDYELQYNRNTWTATVVFIDPATGQPPQGIADAAGNILQPAAIGTFNVFQETPFVNFLAPPPPR